MPKTSRKADEFLDEAQAPRAGLIREFWEFVKHNKKWWILPILAVLLVIGLLVALGAAGLSPFIYTLF